MVAPRAQQVIQEQVLLCQDRYDDYHADLINILNTAIRAVVDGIGASDRRKQITSAVTAKASQISPSDERS